MIKKLSINGLRGFSSKQELVLGEPTGEIGSGLTVIVGPNSGGKSTVIEGFRSLSKHNDNSFTEGKRNIQNKSRVEINLEDFSGKVISLETVSSGGSEAIWVYDESDGIIKPKVFFLPSRRVFNPYFNRIGWDRNSYVTNSSDFQFRGEAMDNFSSRLFNANGSEKREGFNKLLSKILGYELDWNIDQNESGQYYVKVEKNNNISHSSDGLGEGVVSLLFLVDALFESNEDELLVIDEPELSLHPQLQRRLLDRIMEYSKDRQIVYATHSPELISIESILNGGALARIVNSDNGSEIFSLSPSDKVHIEKLVGDLYNPHILGYDAKACFFEEDGLIIVEGQEDVVFMNLALDLLGIEGKIRFFGYGAGGSGKIFAIASVLKSLGFKDVGCLYDGDKAEEAKKTEASEGLDGYKIYTLQVDDIRDKEGKDGKIAKKGVFGLDKKIKTEHEKWFSSLIKEMLSDN